MLSKLCSSGNVQRYSGDIYISVYFRKKYHLISVVSTPDHREHAR